MVNIPKIFAVVILLSLIAGCGTEQKDSSSNTTGQDWKQVVNLAGEWKFSVGDNPTWASYNLNDNNWEKIQVPSSWENQGFHGYDGYAWYRKTFEIPSEYKNNVIYVFLGYVDDVDQVFINGKPVGYSGSFPPAYRTAYNFFRRYPVPASLIKFDGKNTIAVRVYDDELEGGILRGNIGIYIPGYLLKNSIMLVGSWKFKTGDNSDWKDNSYNDSDWTNLIVPGYWESQGYPDYAGFAWYRREVYIPQNLSDKKLILMLGKIDDLDEVYINGKLVGSTGNFNNPYDLGDNYLKLRGYYLSKGDLKYGSKNLIAVRVYDGFRDGGIYEGPVAIVPQKEYTDYWNKKRQGDNLIDKIFD